MASDTDEKNIFIKTSDSAARKKSAFPGIYKTITGIDSDGHADVDVLFHSKEKGTRAT